MLHRVVLVGEMTGSAGRTTLSLAEILGVSEHNNRRDQITSAMIFHGGEAAQIIEGARADVDRLTARLLCDPRFRSVRVLEDRPVMQRRIREPARLCALRPPMAEEVLDGGRLGDLPAERLEQLLSWDRLKIAA